MVPEKIRKVARTAGTIVLGLLALAVFGPWLPGKTGEGFEVWLGLLALLLIVGIIFFRS